MARPTCGNQCNAAPEIVFHYSPTVTNAVTIVSPEPLEVPYEARYAWPAATYLPVLGQPGKLRKVLVVT